MSLADELMKIAPGSPEVESLRGEGVAGDADALRRYVLWTQWEKIRHDKRLGLKDARQVFRRFIDAYPLEVKFNG